VLREVAVKRAIIELHHVTVSRSDIAPYSPYTGERISDEYEVACDICGWATADPSSACATLRNLAAVYSDHPDYREEWKP
jgi:hypothetical protein